MRAYPSLFASLNVNKRSIALDLKHDADRARALELAADTDVVVEGYRPGVADRLGVGYDAVRACNPSVIYCSVSGMGQDGPLRLAPGHDLNYQAWAGVLAPDGGQPISAQVPIADLAGGMAAAFAIVAAVVRRQRTGEGERVDVAMADVLATWTGAQRPHAAGTDPDARGVPGYGTFVAGDGKHLVLGVLTEQHFWSALCDVLKLGEHRDLDFTARLGRQKELQAALAGAIATRPRDALVHDMQAADVPVAPVLDRDEMLALEHFRARGVSTADPWADPSVGYPVQFARHPARRVEPPPTLDEHRGAGFRARPERPG
jgi:crotonobetainyl-CoA:carnitine CoA-transferase CaiB-like acyl-CoA transferase